MKILITGAKGQLGKKLIDVLKTSHQLILTDRDNMDITDIDTVIKVAEKEKPDFRRSYPVAANIVGIANKKENSVIKTFGRPKMRPEIITAPERETPGTTASD